MGKSETSRPSALSREEEVRNSQAVRKAFLLMGLAACVVAGTGWLCLGGHVHLAGATKSLPDFQSKLEFTLKYQTLPLCWILLLVVNVILGRVQTGAINPLDGRDTAFQARSNILQNTFEQFILCAFSQLILVAFIDETYTLRAIPWINFLFLFGRIAFWAGYPNYRSFGFFTGNLLILGSIGVCLYKFFQHLM